MIIKNFKKSSAGKIKDILSRLSLNDFNRQEGIYLDEVLNLFLKLKDEFTVPGIPVKELDYIQGAVLFEEVIRQAPLYFYGHNFMEKRKPAAEEHSLQFYRKIEGLIVDFVHIIRVNFRFTPGSGSIISQGNSGTYPSYKTDRLFYKSRLVPVKKGSDPEEIQSVKIKDADAQEADNRLFTSVVFDESSSGSMSVELSMKAGPDVYPFPAKIYPFVFYDYFTACLVLPDPLPDVLEKGAEIFEPLFFYIYSNYRDIRQYPGFTSEAFSGSLNIENDLVSLTGDYAVKLKNFFSRYSIYTDEALMLKGLRRVEISEPVKD